MSNITDFLTYTVSELPWDADDGSLSSLGYSPDETSTLSSIDPASTDLFSLNHSDYFAQKEHTITDASPSTTSINQDKISQFETLCKRILRKVSSALTTAPIRYLDKTEFSNQEIEQLESIIKTVEATSEEELTTETMLSQKVSKIASYSFEKFMNKNPQYSNLQSSKEYASFLLSSYRIFRNHISSAIEYWNQEEYLDVSVTFHQMSGLIERIQTKIDDSNRLLSPSSALAIEKVSKATETLKGIKEFFSLYKVVRNNKRNTLEAGFVNHPPQRKKCRTQ